MKRRPVSSRTPADVFQYKALSNQDVIRCRTVYLVFAFKNYNAEIMEVSFQFTRNDNDHIEFKQISRLPPVWAKMADLVDSSFSQEFPVW